MKRILIALAGLTMSAGALASEGQKLPLSFKQDTGNLASVQRGARNFMGYCSGCHSMKHMRYSRIGRDLGIPDEMLKKNLMFTSEKPGEPIKSSMPDEDSKKWFGQTPPDLSVETRMRGADWVYNYLMTFYADESRPMGVNNLVLPGASMPHVLWELQGWQQKAEAHAAKTEGGHEGAGHGTGLELVQAGTLSPDDYRKFVSDTVNFMAYAAEPGREGRISMGIKVIFYLILLSILAYLLKREFWRDVH